MMRHLPLAIFIALLAAGPLVLPEFTVTLLNYIGLYAIVAVGLVLLTGVGGLTSFGQAAFVGLGAYTTAWLTTTHGFLPWLTLFIGLAITGAVAFFLGFITLRIAQGPDAVRDQMATSHALLFPTLDETFGFVAAEALATGLPVIGSKLRAIPEILPADLLADAIPYETDDGVWTGLRLWRREGREAFERAYGAARDVAVATLRARVEAFANDAAGRAARAASYRAHYLARFTPEAMGARLHEVYARALNR